MPFQNENVADGIAKDNQVQVGRADLDTGFIGQGFNIPWASDPSASWVYFECTIECMLDSGIVVHNRLPQVNKMSDSLATAFIDDPKYDTNAPQPTKAYGITLKSQDQYTDIVQRMGHSRYWFRMWGKALRAGYQIPIPALKTIGGVPAIPYDKNPQWAYNRIFPGTNCGGVILWHAAWSLWYTTAIPPTSNTVPAADPMAHISAADVPPQVITAPPAAPDDSSTPTFPPIKRSV